MDGISRFSHTEENDENDKNEGKILMMIKR
jgi:hypothetical protein